MGHNEVCGNSKMRFLCTFVEAIFSSNHRINSVNRVILRFFLMHLINKPDTEYTGQETFVWNMYQQRSWDFFPVGDCFRKQYEDELGGGGG